MGAVGHIPALVWVWVWVINPHNAPRSRNQCAAGQTPLDRPPPPPLHHRASGTNLTQEQGKTTRWRQAGHLPPGCPLQGPASSEAPKGQGELGVKAAQPLQENKTRPIPCHSPCHSPCPQERMQAVASQSCNCLEILRTAKARHPLWGLCAPVPTAGGSARQPAEGPPDECSSPSTTKATTGRFRPANSPSDLCQRLLVDGFVHRVRI